MSTNPDPNRASPTLPSSPPPSSIRETVTLSPITKAHHQFQDHFTSQLHRSEITSTHRAGSGSDTKQTISSLPSVDQHIQYFQESPVDDNNTYTGRPVLDTSRRYNNSGLLPTHSTKFTGQNISTLSPTPESPTGDQVPPLPSSSTLTSLRRPSGHYHTFAPEQESDHLSIHSSTSIPIPPSPAFSISSFSNILSTSASISNIINTTGATGGVVGSGVVGGNQSKNPVLEYKHPIIVKDFDSIHILSQPQQAAIKTLCSSRVYSRIDTIGWYSILGAQKFPPVLSR
jgi:hypothetical protein